MVPRTGSGNLRNGRKVYGMSSYATDGACGLTWDDSIVTSMTPAPSGRCPFEAFHVYDGFECEELEPDEIPPDWPVQPHVSTCTVQHVS